MPYVWILQSSVSDFMEPWEIEGVYSSEEAARAAAGRYMGERGEWERTGTGCFDATGWTSHGSGELVIEKTKVEN